MPTIRKFKTGETIPPGGKFLHTKVEVDPDSTRYEWRPTPGFWGSVPLIRTETQYRIRDQAHYHYYEFPNENEIG